MLRKEMIGRMIIGVELEKIALDKACEYLEKKGVMVELMGYIDARI